MEDNAPIVIDLNEPAESNNLAFLRAELGNLMIMAFTAGYVITVDLQPLEPLAMGNYRMVGNVRKGRE